ncbi:MAG TPA: hypothetical protein VE553_04255 [Candidatus Binatia bacterium]|nr:hypothetical protein [Candidatus Binatia bacterium]
MDQEELYALMMEALDGELSDADMVELEIHLRARPRLAREWEAMRAVDALFRSSPVLQPAVNLRQQTLARLPGSRQRLYAGVIIYLVLLASGLIPLGAIAWIAVQLFPILSQPAFVRSLWQGGVEFFGLLQVMFLALLNGAGEFVRQQPLALAWLIVIFGVIALWGSVYNRLVLHSQRADS